MNFKVAFQFSTQDKTTDEIVNLNDPNYVKMIVKLFSFDKDGLPYEKIILHHECTEEEYNEFYPIVSRQEFGY